MKTTVLLLALFSALLPAQPVSSPATPAFEVVSIRRHIEGTGPVQIEQTPDGFRSIGIPMLAIFQMAYPRPNEGGVLRGDRIERAPGWLSSELYDVVAKIHPADIAEWRRPEMRQTMLGGMLRAMLVERCKVVAHYGSKETPVYDLVVMKGGPKFKRAETVDAAELRRKHPTGGMMRASATVVVHGPKTTEFYAISMATLANTILPSLAGKPVVDKTELPGYYDVRLPSSALAPPPPPPAPAASEPLDTPSPPLENESIFAALPEWLGLRLRPARGRVEMLVIDHVERPSEN